MSQPTTDGSIGAAPDEVMIIPTEEFLQALSENFKDQPFVALNLTRSMVVGPGEGEQGNNTVLVSAIGFHMEDLAVIPSLTHGLTGAESVFITVPDSKPELAEIVKKQLGLEGAEEGSIPVLNPPLPSPPSTHPELVDNSTRMQF